MPVYKGARFVRQALDSLTSQTFRRVRYERTGTNIGAKANIVDLRKVVGFHREHGRLATVVAVRPRARFGCLDLDGSRVAAFSEKPQTREISGGLFVLEPGVIDYIEDDRTHWEREPLEGLARDGELWAYQHNSFWQCMDTLRERNLLQELWDSAGLLGRSGR